MVTPEMRSAKDPPRYVIEAGPRPRLAQDVAATLHGHHFELSELVAIPPDLEQVYLDLTRPPRDAAA